VKAERASHRISSCEAFDVFLDDTVYVESIL
jgi:hypothetical protein